MNFSLVYLVNRFFYRIFDFGRDWYIGSFLYIGRHTINFLESLDQIFAWRITLKNLFQPLYQDHTIVGHTLGFIFRSLRMIIGGIIYLFIFIIAAAIYLAWIAIPIYVVYAGFL